MKICPGCGSVNLDERHVCGVCGQSLATATVLRPGEEPPPPPTQPLPRNLKLMSTKRLVSILVTIGIAIVFTVGGIGLETSSAGHLINLVGLQMAIFGLIIFMALLLGSTGGLFSGWRGWWLEWVRKKNPNDPRMAPREPEEDMSD